MTRISDRPTEISLEDAKALHGRLVAALGEVAALVRVQNDLAAKNDQLLASPFNGDVEWHVAELDQIAADQAEVERSLTTARNRCMVLGDALIGPKLRARTLQIQALQDQVRQAEQETAALVEKRTDHLKAAEQLTDQIGRKAERISDLLREANQLEPRHRRVHVYPKSATFQPPADVLVKWSMWRSVIQRLVAAGVEEADLVIDEALAEIVASPLQD